MEALLGLTVGLVAFVTVWALGSAPMPALVLFLFCLIVGIALGVVRPNNT